MPNAYSAAANVRSGRRSRDVYAGRVKDVYSEDVTVVTAYFDLGSFQKGNKKPRTFTKRMYEKRLEEYRRLDNHLVAFFDDRRIYNNFKKLRSHLKHKTKVIFIQRNTLRAFRLIGKVREILASEGYPKYHPDTVVPEYGCAMNAKYELVQRAAKENYFNTTYFAWFDGGFFQNQTDSFPFMVATPPGFDASKVAYGQMLPRNSELYPRQIYLTNQYWVCGCVFIARRDVMLKWTSLYKSYYERFLNQGLASTDEQVLYAMFSEKIDKPSIQIQTYWARPERNEWHILGYLMKDNWKCHSLRYC